MKKTLILGGSSLASGLAKEMVAAGLPAIYSYAGRTDNPIVQPLPTRVGGFGGVDGLVQFISDNDVGVVVDATHPFAAQMSANAVAAADISETPLLALENEPWEPQEGDNWIEVANIEEAVNSLDGEAKRVFLAIGRLNIEAFAAQPQHHYLLRLVDEPDGSLPLPNVSVVVARGPFTLDGDLALMREHSIELVVSKNAGGTAARAKIDAALALDLPVIMIKRPEISERPVVRTVDEVMHWLHHDADLGV